MIPDWYWILHILCAVPAFVLGWHTYKEEGSPDLIWTLPPAALFASWGPLGLIVAFSLRKMQQTGD